MLKAYEETKGVSLLGGTGVSEEDLLQTIPKFMEWAEQHRKNNILKFFTTTHVKGRIISAFALVGLKTIIDELNKETEKKE